MTCSNSPMLCVPNPLLDVNVFIPPNRWPLLSDALRPLAIEMEVNERELKRFGEIELDWDSNLEEIRGWLERMVGSEDPRMGRLLEIESSLAGD